MIPMVLDPRAVPLAVVGRGAPAVRRLEALLAGGAQDLAVFSDAPSADLARAAGERLHRRLPSSEEFAAARVVWVADLPQPLAAELAAAARAAGALVNVEDVKPLCDFHNVSQVRRGDLLLTVSTGGASPGLAVRIREHLERAFPPDWAERLAALGAARAAWRGQGRPPGEVARRTRELVDEGKWLT